MFYSVQPSTEPR